nr:MAG TPA: hypothetical protein [Caudoviricetes sp.]
MHCLNRCTYTIPVLLLRRHYETVGETLQSLSIFIVLLARTLPNLVR